jgi:hypothetical protein
VYEHVALFALALPVVVGQGWITREVVRSDFYERPQKALQIVMIWAMPVVGAVIAFAALRHQRDVPNDGAKEEIDDDGDGDGAEVGDTSTGDE